MAKNNKNNKLKQIPDKENLNVLPGQKARITKAINEFKTESTDLFNQLESIVEDSKKLKEESDQLKKKIGDVLKEATENKDSTEQEKKEIIQLYNELFVPKDDSKPIKEEIDSAKKEILDNLELVNGRKGDFDNYYNKIFGVEDDKGKKTIGLKQEIKANQEKLDKLHESENRKFKTLFNKIESLLPGATSVGLASTFADQKNSYFWPSLVWSAIFIATMIATAVFGFFTWQDLNSIKEQGLEMVIAGILTRSPFFLAIIWLGYFASKQQSQNKRLQQEYAHKEAVSKSYEGFKRQIQDLGQTKDHKAILIALLEKVANSIGENPSNTLDNDTHREDPPIVDKINSVFGKNNKNNNKKKKDPETEK